jgi:crotonobetainyl-CoA:carnitine CoA-transferase CaiB-like acyl-CoA transferase
MAGALDGIKVIDFGQYIAGPMTAMLLGDQGADVIRVDPPGGPVWDSAANATYNRNKRSIVLDLKSDAGRDLARTLVEGADIVIENFRPGVMDRLGLGAAAMTAANPRLIYCSIPGFAADDPRAATPGWEGVVGAATGVYPLRPGAAHPVYTAMPISSTYAAIQSAVAITMALNARERSGLGQVVEVPLFDATFGAIGFGGQRVHSQEQAPIGDVQAAQRAAGGNPNMVVGGQIQCKDGRYVMYMGGNKEARHFLEATGASEWVDALLAGKITIDEARARTEALFKTRTAQEWEDFSEQIGTECAVCRPSAEWLDNPGALGSGIIVDIVDPKLGKVRGPGIAVRMSATPPSIRSPRALPDSNRQEILAELSGQAVAAATNGSTPPAAVESMLRSALEGVRVLDLCIVLAGPTCGRTLGEYGADVIKIDRPVQPNAMAGRGGGGAGFHTDINRAKRSIMLDLKQPEGLEVFMKLVDSADVVVQNFRNHVATRVGFGYEQVKARKPGIVYGSLNAYGQVGPFEGRPGHEQILQAATGAQERYGGSGRPLLQPYAVNDYGTGFMGALGVALALYHRQRTGEGQHVDSALAYTATMLQSSMMQAYEGKVWDEPRGQDAIGSGPLNRAYQASDGWFFFAARPSDLAKSPDLRDLAGRSGPDLERALEERFRGATGAGWIGRLTAAGIGAHGFDSARDLMERPWVQDHGLSVTREHSGLGLVTTTGPAARLSRTPCVPGRPAPQPGEDAAGILAEIGLSPDLDRLIAAGIVSGAAVPVA